MPASVIAAVVTSGPYVLAGKRNDGKPPWTFIAGEPESQESPADTAIREVKEETGLTITAGHTIAERMHPATGKHIIYVAAFPADQHTSVFVGDQEELAEVRWLTLTETDALFVPPIYTPVREYLFATLTAFGILAKKEAV